MCHKCLVYFIWLFIKNPQIINLTRIFKVVRCKYVFYVSQLLNGWIINGFKPIPSPPILRDDLKTSFPMKLNPLE